MGANLTGRHDSPALPSHRRELPAPTFPFRGALRYGQGHGAQDLHNSARRNLAVTDRINAAVAGSRVIAADSGMRHADVLGLTPELWVGDFDSSDEALTERWPDIERLTFPAAKSETDGEIATAEAIARGATRMIFVGALGGERTDHALQHLLHAMSLAEKGYDVLLTSGDEEAMPLPVGAKTFDLPQGALFSVLGLSDLEGLDILGARYPLANHSLPFGSSRTVSNVAEGPVEFHLKSGRAMILARPHDFLEHERPMAPPILKLDDIFLSFGGTPLLNGAGLQVEPGDRICLVGRNGSGKSTLMKIAAGMVEAQSGEVFRHPSSTIRYLEQAPDFAGYATVQAYAEAGLGPGDDPYRVTYLLEHLGLTGEEDPKNLSGGESRRAALARVMAPEPDILMLDEPTNHLDLPTIEWLEDELRKTRSALVLISHDRRFLEKVSTATVWLDRGTSRRLDRGFSHFEAWRDEVLEAEELEQHKLGKAIEREEHWMRYGVTARRKRNMRRVGELQAMRASYRGHKGPQGSIQPRLRRQGKRQAGHRSGRHHQDL